VIEQFLPRVFLDTSTDACSTGILVQVSEGVHEQWLTWMSFPSP